MMKVKMKISGGLETGQPLSNSFDQKLHLYNQEEW
jgi:hypothetical protein